MSEQPPEAVPQDTPTLAGNECSKGAGAIRARPENARCKASWIGGIVCGSSLLASAYGAEVLSDRVVFIESDARSHSVQHTLISDGARVTLVLPDSVIAQRVVFSGPDREAFLDANRARPDRIAIRSGSVFARYRHRFDDAAVQRLADGRQRLLARSLPERLSIDTRDHDGRRSRIEATTSWVFPADAEVIAYQASDPLAGSFSLEANTLAWTQRSATPVTLMLDYRLQEEPSGRTPESMPRAATNDPVDTTAVVEPARAGATPDEDGDDVPGETAICVGTPTEFVPGRTDAERRVTPSADYTLPGCGESLEVVLDSVDFPTGQSWLDVPARRALDRVAAALGQHPGGLREIAAFTDGLGSRARNLAISVRRARAVRQYLLLRGVSPGHLNAGGYGEADPIASNSTAAGRARNRRVVLRPFNAPEEDR